MQHSTVLNTSSEPTIVTHTAVAVFDAAVQQQAQQLTQCAEAKLAKAAKMLEQESQAHTKTQDKLQQLTQLETEVERRTQHRTQRAEAELTQLRAKLATATNTLEWQQQYGHHLQKRAEALAALLRAGSAAATEALQQEQHAHEATKQKLETVKEKLLPVLQGTRQLTNEFLEIKQMLGTVLARILRANNLVSNAHTRRSDIRAQRRILSQNSVETALNVEIVTNACLSATAGYTCALCNEECLS